MWWKNKTKIRIIVFWNELGFVQLSQSPHNFRGQKEHHHDLWMRFFFFFFVISGFNWMVAVLRKIMAAGAVVTKEASQMPPLIEFCSPEIQKVCS